MKKNITYLLMTLGIFSLGVASARTWTSADGSNTFKGDFVSYDKDTNIVKVTRGIRSVKFNADKLSDADREWLKAQGAPTEEQLAAKAKEEAAAALEGQKIGSKLGNGVLSKLEGDKFVDFAMTAAPDYYVVYYSGSW